ncbi:hypothetical protein CBER1_03078 [Cercospora berteroae]|uniref:Uncharacterized protein n=1 Tax=Cercospora berteroae TaxID=357750 RepID=A0A2S6CHG7_9PEZI|nr:hypothetical protein CBER1_03078 [Cercospora berteroae]
MPDLTSSEGTPSRLTRQLSAFQGSETSANDVAVDSAPLNKSKPKKKSRSKKHPVLNLDFYDTWDHPKARIHRKRFPRVIRADRRRTYASPPVQRLLVRKQAEAAKTEFMKAARTRDQVEMEA